MIVFDVPWMTLVKGINQNSCTKLEMFGTLTMLEAFEYLFHQKFIVLRLPHFNKTHNLMNCLLELFV